MKKKSISWSIALKFSVFLAVFVLLISIAIIFLLTKQVRSKEEHDLDISIETLEKIVSDGNESILQHPEETHIPYFISWTVSDADNKEIIYSNDSFIPVFDDSDGKAIHYTQKDYYTDGDLNIIYIAKESADEKYLLQASMNMDRDSLERSLSLLPLNLLLIFLPLLIISFFTAYIISKNTLKPITKITNAAKGISSSNLESLLPVSRKNNELDELALTFNNLFQRLKSDFEKEKAFTSNVSHELKTPVAVIQGHAKLLQRWGKDDPIQLEKSLVEISKETGTMSSIISNLLQLTHLENKDIKLNLTTLNITALLERLKDETFSWSPETTFEINCDSNLSTVTDEELLHQVCTIIIHNSVKFSTEKPCHIVISAKKSNDCSSEEMKIDSACKTDAAEKILAISFMDNGPGIKEEILPNIFQRFFRGDEAHNRKAGGSGLGLSIAKEIMNVLQGSIKAENVKNQLEINENSSNQETASASNETSASMGISRVSSTGAIFTITLPLTTKQ